MPTIVANIMAKNLSALNAKNGLEETKLAPFKLNNNSAFGRVAKKISLEITLRSPLIVYSAIYFTNR